MKIIKWAIAVILVLAMIWVFFVAPPCNGNYQLKIGGENYFLFDCKTSGISPASKSAQNQATVDVEVWPQQQIGDSDPNAWTMAPNGSLKIMLEGNTATISPSEWNTLGSITRSFRNINRTKLGSIDIQFSSGLSADNMGFVYQVSSGSKVSKASAKVIFGPNKAGIIHHPVKINLSN